ncbi:MAG: hypothetical protein K2M91_08080 [Lachnospiraceae bacterium]|nr:hypothetical protein [Lachnospiraceae bacterium]
MNFEMILDLLLIACGAYVIYGAIQMKVAKKIPDMLVGKEFPVNRAKDTEGFIRFTFPLTVVVGIVLFVVGLVGVLGLLAAHPMAETVMQIIMGMSVITYGMVLLSAQRKYLVGKK